MRRALLGASLLAAALWIGWNLFHTSDRERVEALVERLLRRAAEGGEEASEEILSALAPDYRGTTLPRAGIESILRGYVTPRRVASLDSGAIHPAVKEDEIVVPLRLTAQVGRDPVTLLLTIHFSEDGEGNWRVSDVTRWR